MLSPLEFVLLLATGGVVWFILVSLRMRERANGIARQYCHDRNMQFLDGSVGFGTLGVVRENGRLHIRRVYIFDYSEDNHERRHAALVFLNSEFKSLLLLEP